MTIVSLRNSLGRVLIVGIACVSLWVGLLEVVYHAWPKLRIVAPSPSSVLVEWFRLSTSRELWRACQETLEKVAKAIIYSLAVGYPAGFVIGLLPLRFLLTTPLNAGRAIPASMLAPVLMLVVDFGSPLVIAMATFPTLTMILIGVSEAVAADTGPRRSTCRALGMTRWQTIRHCVFWESLAKTVLVLVTALPMTVALVVVLEYFDQDTTGLGSWVSRGRMMQDPTGRAVTYAALIWVGLLGVAATYLPQAVGTYFQRWTK